MVKAKVIKELRKQVERAERDVLANDKKGGGSNEFLRLLDRHCRASGWTSGGSVDPSHDKHSNGCRQGEEEPVESPEQEGSSRYRLEYAPSVDEMPESTIDACLDLFELNMADHYRASSFGLDLNAKREEMTHRKARYLLLFDATSPIREAERSAASGLSGAAAAAPSDLVAFVHFRFCLDDDDAPSCAVLYVYEIQVSERHAGRTVGTALMALLQDAAALAGLGKVALTALKSNARALRFYKDRLGYRPDGTDPGACGEAADYEILSKPVAAPPLSP
jgi:ribosomal protein S18 acetylase RimI-like enzyme